MFLQPFLKNLRYAGVKRKNYEQDIESYRAVF